MVPDSLRCQVARRSKIARWIELANARNTWLAAARMYKNHNHTVMICQEKRNKIFRLDIDSFDCAQGRDTMDRFVASSSLTHPEAFELSTSAEPLLELRSLTKVGISISARSRVRRIDASRFERSLCRSWPGWARMGEYAEQFTHI
jgi:hypothetical protein